MSFVSEFLKGGHYFELYQKVFALHKKHAGAKTMAEWRALVSDCAAINPGFESKLMSAVIDEIERAHKGKGDIE